MLGKESRQKPKRCEIGRPCGFGCVPKSHGCKGTLKGIVKTAVDWLTKVTTGIAKKVKSRIGNKKEGGQQKNPLLTATIFDPKKDIKEIDKNIKLSSSLAKKTNDELTMGRLDSAGSFWGRIKSEAQKNKADFVTIRSEHGIESMAVLGDYAGTVHVKYMVTNPKNLLQTGNSVRGAGKMALVQAAKKALSENRGLSLTASDLDSANFYKKMGMTEHPEIDLFKVEPQDIASFIDKNTRSRPEKALK
jgi:hypothetical protein